LEAVKYDVTVKKTRKEIVLLNEEKEQIPVLNCITYEAPSFMEFPKTFDYKDSVYTVKEKLDVPYANAKGYWTSYPDTGDSNFQIFVSRIGDLKMKQQELTMDVYMPDDDGSATRPLLVLIHGGAFYNGDKADLSFPEWARYFAGLGYVVASVNYRLGFHMTTASVEKAGYRAVQDVNAAIVRLVHDKDKYGIDPERVFVAGTSAGGITALNVAFMRDENIPASAKEEGGVMDVNKSIVEPFTIRAVGNMWGAVEDTSILDNAQTAVISIHSRGDHVVPFGADHAFSDFFANKILFPITYGSGVITDILGKKRSKLMAYDIPHRHTLQITWEPTGEQHLNERFWEIEFALRDFFSDHMMPHPVKISHGSNSQFFTVNVDDVKSISWKVEGGVILSNTDSSAEVLLFPDASDQNVIVSGEYKSGLTFYEKLAL